MTTADAMHESLHENHVLVYKALFVPWMVVARAARKLGWFLAFEWPSGCLLWREDEVRAMLVEGTLPPTEIMRPATAEILIDTYAARNEAAAPAK